MEEKKEVMTIDQFGICPMCGSLMGMLESNYTMYGLTPNGKYPNRILETEKDITYACQCGYRAQMVMTPAGIYPKNHEKVDKIDEETVGKLATVVGYVEGEEKNATD